MIRVADIARSAAFYRLLGFEIGNYVPPSGPMHWAWLYSVKADDWKPGGEFQVSDPDGYTLMIAQSGADTP